MRHPLFLQALEFIQKNSLLQKGDRLLIGFSGGSDSTFLVELLKNLQPKFNFHIALAHVNYGVRPTALRDEKFVRSYAQKNQLPLYILNAKTNHLTAFHVPDHQSLPPFHLPSAIKKEKNFEKRARQIRYYFFQFLASKLKYSKILIGHQKDDLVETFLLNLFRGSGLDGLSSLKPQKQLAPHLFVIRPLLSLEKKSLRQFLKQKHVAFVEDETNLRTQYTRNRLRHHLLPLLEKNFNPNIKSTLFKEALLLQNLQTALEKQFQKKQSYLQIKYQPRTNTLYFNRHRLTVIKNITQKDFFLRQLINQVRGDCLDINYDQFQKLYNFLENPQKKHQFREISRLTITKNGDKVAIKPL